MSKRKLMQSLIKMIIFKSIYFYLPYLGTTPYYFFYLIFHLCKTFKDCLLFFNINYN